LYYFQHKYHFRTRVSCLSCRQNSVASPKHFGMRRHIRAPPPLMDAAADDSAVLGNAQRNICGDSEEGHDRGGCFQDVLFPHERRAARIALPLSPEA
jgi:hypothetical protein